MNKIIKKLKKLKKPSKKYIRQEILNEIRNEMREAEKKFHEKLEDMRLCTLGKYNIHVSGYKKDDWYVEVTIPVENDSFGHRYHLFIDKESGKNRYPRKEGD